MKLRICREITYAGKPGGQFPPLKWEKKTPLEEQQSRQVSRLMTCIITLKFTPLRFPPQTPLVKANYPVSPQMEDWNGLKCVNITYTRNIIQTQLVMTVYWFPFSNIVFECFNVIYIFHVIRYHVPNFCSHLSKRTDSNMFRIYISPSKVSLSP